MIDTAYALKCCAIGSNCGISACDAASYICAATITSSGTATVTASCCARSCPTTSQFLCAASLGGQCCGYGEVCASGSRCVPATTVAKPGVGSLGTSGCTTNQFACPTAEGGGCCDVGAGCTMVDNVNYCAASTGMATRTGINGILATAAVEESSAGLSTGAKAGIGAGVAIGTCLAVGIFLWFCLAHRRRSRISQHSDTAPGADMSQGSETGIARPIQGRQAADYFGPAATPGPFSEASSPTSPLSARSVGVNRGVGIAQSPGDITTPVEIDSRDHSNVTSPGLFEYTKGPVVTIYPVEMP